jgi:hypothetical protein
MLAQTTVEHVGTKSIPIKTTGHEKARVTIVLCAMASGRKIPPLIVFKGVRMERGVDQVAGKLKLVGHIS